MIMGAYRPFSSAHTTVEKGLVTYGCTARMDVVNFGQSQLVASPSFLGFIVS